MKLSDYIKELTDILEEHGEHECYYARDSEGNGFHSVSYSPTRMYKVKGSDEYYEDLYNMDEERHELEEVCDIDEDDEEDVYNRLEVVICVN